MTYSAFTSAMAEEAVRQGGDQYYYSVVTVEPPREGEKLFHMETVHLRPGNPAHDSYSVAKSVSSMAAGLLCDRGLLSMNNTLGDYLGEYLVPGTDPEWGNVTVHRLLRHRTGAERGVDFDMTNAHLWEDPEWLHTLFAIPIVSPPEDRFVYSDGNYYILGRIVEKLTGVDMEAFLQKEVFVPLGFHVQAWSRDVAGHTVGGTGLYVRTEDLARIGWLWLNRGLWGDHRIFSEAWAHAFLDFTPDAVANYGYGIGELAPRIHGAGGMYGQGICFDEETRRAVAFHCFDPEGKTRGLAGAFVKFCRS